MQRQCIDCLHRCIDIAHQSMLPTDTINRVKCLLLPEIFQKKVALKLQASSIDASSSKLCTEYYTRGFHMHCRDKVVNLTDASGSTIG